MTIIQLRKQWDLIQSINKNLKECEPESEGSYMQDLYIETVSFVENAHDFLEINKEVDADEYFYEAENCARELGFILPRNAKSYGVSFE